METLQYLLIFRIVRKLELPTFLAVLPVLSNRLHLYNVRVVINDFPAVLMMFLYINFIISKRYVFGVANYR
jgi:putative flippase GtrA